MEAPKTGFRFNASPYWNYISCSGIHSGRVFGLNPCAIIFPKMIRCRTLKDMQPEEIRNMEREYGCRVNGRYQWGLM